MGTVGEGRGGEGTAGGRDWAGREGIWEGTCTMSTRMRKCLGTQINLQVPVQVPVLVPADRQFGNSIPIRNKK